MRILHSKMTRICHQTILSIILLIGLIVSAASQESTVTTPSDDRGSTAVPSNNQNGTTNFGFLTSIMPVLNMLMAGIGGGTSGNLLSLFSQLPVTDLSKVGPKCMSDFNDIMSGVSSGELWALQILDAYGKPERGILHGDLNWLGNYQQCLEFYITPLNAYLNPVNPTKFETKYCRLAIPIGGLLPENMKAIGETITLGSCMPQSCSPSDVTALTTALQRMMNVSEPLSITAECLEEKKIETREVVVICILSLIGFMILAGTLYDVIAVQMKGCWGKLESAKHGLKMHDPVVLEKYGPSSVMKVNDDKDVNGEVGNCLPEWTASPVDPVDTLTPDTLESKLNLTKEIKTEVKKSDDEKGTLEKIVLSFSVYTNGVKILSTNQAAGSLGAVNGIRFLSMCWVILGHTIVFLRGGYSNNIESYAIMRAMERWSFLAIVNGTFSVDSFFVLSGLLVAYLTLRGIEKAGGGKGFNWVMFYFHRIWRLTPTYMLVLMVGTVIYPLVTQGPVVSMEGHMGNCEEYFWTNLLYINNIICDSMECLREKSCMGWSWYLANDMQFYIISPLMLLPLYYNVFAGMAVCLFFMSMAVGTNAYFHFHHEYPAQINLSPFLPTPKDNNAFLYTYLPCYARVGPYVVGIFTGYLLYKWKCKCDINKMLNIVLWLLCACLSCTIMYSIYNEWDSHIFTVSESTAYGALSRTGWGVVVAWVVFACATGNGGWIDEVLSWKAFIPLGRLTYCAYLVHPLMMYGYQDRLPQQFQVTDLTLSYLFVAHLVFSYGSAFLTSLAFEAPMMGLEKVIITKKQSGKS